MKIKIGITGQSGFLGTHLFNHLRAKNDIERIHISHDLFVNEDLLIDFVKKCDYIVHLAGMSRHKDASLIYETNMRLVQQLISAMEAECVTPHILFASTTHKQKDSPYHASKRDGQSMLEAWADKNSASTTSLVMPNVFGPYCRPCFNSFIATFCDKVSKGEECEIFSDSMVQLIYVTELCEKIFKFISSGKTDREFYPAHSVEKKVTEILALMVMFKTQFIDKNIIPHFNNQFEFNLYTTLISY